MDWKVANMPESHVSSLVTQSNNSNEEREIIMNEKHNLMNCLLAKIWRRVSVGKFWNMKHLPFSSLTILAMFLPLFSLISTYFRPCINPEPNNWYLTIALIIPPSTALLGMCSTISRYVSNLKTVYTSFKEHIFSQTPNLRDHCKNFTVPWLHLNMV